MNTPLRQLTAILLLSLAAQAASPESAKSPRSLPDDFSIYFRAETAKVADACLANIESLADWTTHRERLRRELREMLGLEPLPERTDLKSVITGRIEQDDFLVEKLHFQVLPKLYVTANLYLPRKLEKPAPAILYVCGHARVFTNGVSCGNKTGYQHHGAWFARNGYVCLLIDTLQLGEIEGLHHGTYRQGQWWWNARGYTPAGVEAWFGIRALDYLCSRPEVDKERIGMTGRSGGGSYTWTVAALDDRVKVAAPVAGITDLRNQVVDGAIEGHCDCMFFVNTYRWDFPQLAALLAPRPLLIANSDKDTIFPLDGVQRLHAATRRIYQFYGKTSQLGLLITDGPHADTQDLQLPVFRWFNRFLKGEDPVIEMAARKFFEPSRLRVFDQLPADQLNTRIQDQFVPCPAASRSPDEPLRLLSEKVFAGWPAQPCVFDPDHCTERTVRDLRCRCYELITQPGVNLRLYVVTPRKLKKPQKTVLTILDSESWTNSAFRSFWLESAEREAPVELGRKLLAEKTALAFFAPRGVEPAAWLTNKAKLTHLRRRYMLLGQTLDSMRVWDIRCAVQALGSLPQFGKASVALHAKGEMGVNAAYAALFEPGVKEVQLESLPASHMQGPDYLNVLKVWDIPQLIETLGSRTALTRR